MTTNQNRANDDDYDDAVNDKLLSSGSKCRCFECAKLHFLLIRDSICSQMWTLILRTSSLEILLITVI